MWSSNAASVVNCSFAGQLKSLPEFRKSPGSLIPDNTGLIAASVSAHPLSFSALLQCRPGGGPSPAAQIRIILIESNRIVADMARLAAARCIPLAEIVCCFTGRDALLVLRRQPVQLAILGLALPDIDGLDVLASITTERLAHHRLIVSGRQDERTREFLREMRVDGWFDPHTENSCDLRNALRTEVAGWGQPCCLRSANESGASVALE